MTAYPNMTREERGAEYTRVRQEFELWKAKGQGRCLWAAMPACS